MDNEAHPYACTLDDTARLDRIRAWQQIARRATSRRVERGSYVATYPNEAQLLHTLLELIAAEAACCSFLRFRLDVSLESIVTELSLPEGVPDGVRALVLEVFGPCVSRAARPV